MTQILTLIKEYEIQFSNNSYYGAAGARPPYTLIEGTLPILVSAPHAVNQYREEKVKPADMYTGALAILLQSLTDCYCIYSRSCSAEDPNYVLGGEYKAALGKLVKEQGIGFVLDLHGASASRPFDIDLGTVHGTSIHTDNLEQMIQIFRSNGLQKVYENHTFSAAHPGTVTSYSAKELLVQSVQIEINRNYRSLEQPDLFHSTIRSLQQIITEWGGN